MAPQANTNRQALHQPALDHAGRALLAAAFLRRLDAGWTAPGARTLLPGLLGHHGTHQHGRQPRLLRRARRHRAGNGLDRSRICSFAPDSDIRTSRRWWSLPVLFVVGFFVSVPVQHALHPARGREEPEGPAATLRVSCYSVGAPVAVAWIPLAGIPAVFYCFYLHATGLKRVHGISTGRSLLATLMLTTLLLVLAMVLAGLRLRPDPGSHEIAFQHLAGQHFRSHAVRSPLTLAQPGVSRSSAALFAALADRPNC